MSDELTHFNQSGEAHMVDVGSKPSTHRVAIATGKIEMQADTLALIEAGDHNKGDVLGIARVAGIMAAKRAPDLIPLCHPLMISKVALRFEIDPSQNEIKSVATVETQGQTGVEIEALTAVQIALLTIYDMCKGVDRGMLITDIRLEEKSGGKSGHWKRKE